MAFSVLNTKIAEMILVLRNREEEKNDEGNA